MEILAVTGEQIGQLVVVALIGAIIILLFWYAVAKTLDDHRRGLDRDRAEAEHPPRMAGMASVTGDIPRPPLAGADAIRLSADPPTLMSAVASIRPADTSVLPANRQAAELEEARAEIARLRADLDEANTVAERLANEIEMRPRADPIVRRLVEGPLTATLLAEEFGLDIEAVRRRMHYLTEVTRQVSIFETDEEENPVYIWKGVTTVDDLAATP